MSLSSTIKSIQDIMRKDDGVDGDAQRIGQLSWMLFLKVFDQREEEWEAEAKKRGKTYKSPLPEDFRWRNWAAYKNGTPQTPANRLISFVNNKLFPRLKELEVGGSPIRNVVRQVFEDSNNHMKSGTLMLGVIEKLEEAIDFHDFKTRQNLGDIYEQILNDLRAAGNAGEFYTPRAITQVMVRLVNPQMKKHETVMDPACGTGGFLTAAINHMRAQPWRSGPKKQEQIEESILGFEKKQLPHLLCITNLLLHGIDVPSKVYRRNTLAKPFEEWSPHERVDCVITNPPFGGLEDEGVGSDYPANLRTRETADMFLTLIVEKLLKDGGRGAVVLPDGTLFGGGVKAKIKEMLMEKCNLHTIIRLPNGVFAPYTSIKTNLLFFTKGKSTETIWFYEHPYPPGQKSYSKTKPIRLEEFDAEKAWWGSEENDFKDRQENERAWKIDFKSRKQQAKAQAEPLQKRAKAIHNEASALESQIRDLRESLRGATSAKRAQLESKMATNREEVERLRREARDAESSAERIYWPIYNLDIKNPNATEEEIHDPDALLEKYQKLLVRIDETHEQLKTELGAALAHHFEHMEI